MLRTLDRRLVLAILVTLTVAMSFWLGSRIPNLNEKALMGGDAELDLLGFDTVIVIEAHHTYVQRVIYTTINWMDTNKRGMTFGVIFAACLMTLLSLIQRKSFRSSFMNAIMGTVIGAPLGVCVNCAAPIAKGLHAAGVRLETTLATMISSPTLNVIVLTMLIALFPWYVVLTKLALTFVFILVFIPILCRLLFSREQLAAVDMKLASQDATVCELPTNPAGVQLGLGVAAGWREPLLWFVKAFAGHLWYIIRTTVPLMILAGILGSLAIVALPWDDLTRMLPNVGEGRIVTLMVMGGIAIFGTFLPVPIAFDIIVVAVLLATGMPVKYAMVLLFTLGIFSIYSFQIVWTYISRIVALALFFGVVALGVAAGVAGHYVSLWDEARQRQVMYEAFLDASEPAARPIYSVPAGVDDAQLVAELARSAIRGEPVLGVGADGVTVERMAFGPRTAGAGQMFTRIDGAALGIDEPSPFSLLRQLSPRYWGRGVATGDVHNDGWADVLIAADNLSIKGISLYANKQGKGFVKQRVNVPLLNDLQVVNAALVDIDGDGWLDIFVSAYRGGNHIVYNREGRFTRDNVQTLPDSGSTLAAAVSFGDVDADGDMDIVLGNWALGYLRGVVSGEPARARNVLLIQENGTFAKKDLEIYPGETLTSLLTDMNGDGALDLIVGNDFSGSDVYYFGDGRGGFEEIVKDSGVVPHTTDSTMSIASADVNNDLVPEIYVAQIARGEGAGFAKRMIQSEKVCEDIAGTAEYGQCVELMTLNSEIDESRNKRDAVRCVKIDDPLLREDCMALHVVWAAWMLEDQTFCDLVPAHRKDIAVLCQDIFSEHVEIRGAAAKAAIPQLRAHNVLLVSDGNGKFVDRAVEMGLAITGWSWNAKFADLDNDEWQDAYVANGMITRGRQESNYFFHNQGGKAFAERAVESGLVDFRATGGYSYVDYDNDGDLDIISIPVNGPVRVFVNNTTVGNGVVFELRDERGNSFGVGGKIIVRYGPDGSKHQMREIQASGGFISFDAPAAHFGLGAHDRIEEVEIQWSTGQSTLLKGPFDAGAKYIISRRS